MDQIVDGLPGLVGDGLADDDNMAPAAVFSPLDQVAGLSGQVGGAGLGCQALAGVALRVG